MTDNYKLWKDMFDNSQKMMNNWVEAFSNPMSSENTNDDEKQEFDFTNFQDVMSFQQKMYEDWQKMFGALNPQNYANQNPYEVWQSMMGLYNPFDASKLMPKFNIEVFEKM